MRVLLVHKYVRVTGGADVHCLTLSDALTRRGHEVRFVSTASEENPAVAGRFVEPSVTAATKTSLGLRAQARAAATAVWNGDAYRATARLIDEFRPDVVNAHKLYPQLSVSPIVAARRAGIPVIQTVHDYEFVSASPYDHSGRIRDAHEARLRDGSLNTALFAIRRAVHRPRVAAWLAGSDYVAGRMASAGIEAVVVPNIAPPAAAQLRPLDTRDGIAFAGRLTGEKGVDDLIALAALLPEVRVAVAGDGPSRPRVEAASARLGNLAYAGRLGRQEVQLLLAAARVVAIPSTWQEPAGLVALEAMSVGTPVVVYPVGGVEEYVRRSQAGIVARPGPAGLADACRRLLADDAEWHARSQAGLAAVAGVFSEQAHCDAFEEVAATAGAAA